MCEIIFHNTMCELTYQHLMCVNSYLKSLCEWTHTIVYCVIALSPIFCHREATIFYLNEHSIPSVWVNIPQSSVELNHATINFWSEIIPQCLGKEIYTILCVSQLITYYLCEWTQKTILCVKIHFILSVWVNISLQICVWILRNSCVSEYYTVLFVSELITQASLWWNVLYLFEELSHNHYCDWILHNILCEWNHSKSYVLR